MLDSILTHTDTLPSKRISTTFLVVTSLTRVACSPSLKVELFKFLLAGWKDGGGEERGLGRGDIGKTVYPLPCLGHHLQGPGGGGWQLPQVQTVSVTVQSQALECRVIYAIQV